MRLAVMIGALALAAPLSVEARDGPRLESYKTVGERVLKAHVFSPEAKGPRPGVLIFHGGGWTMGRPEWTYAAANILRGQGLVAIPIEYRLSGDGTTPADAQADACDAFVWARTHAAELGIDPERIAGYGVSAGGQLVASAGLGACGPDVRGPDLMLLRSPAVDLAKDGWFQRLLGDAARAEALSPVNLAARGGPSTAVIQGEEDTLTRASGARALCDALIRAGGVCELHLYPGVGHLLTRNLANQESDFDIDPVADRDGDARLNAFLAANGYVETGR